ncbi:hypothetical protein ACETWP_02325, partial [Arthrobacter halodurans]
MGEILRAVGSGRRIYGHGRSLVGGLIVSGLLLSLIGHPAAAVEEDLDPPRILDIWFSSDVVDVVDGSAEWTVRLEIEDAGSGLAPGSPALDPRAMTWREDPIEYKELRRIAGDAHHGIYEAAFTFPEGIDSGQWMFDASIYDMSGNYYSAWRDFYKEGIDREITVHSLPDMTAPRIVQSSVPGHIIDITDGDASATITAEASDQGVGFRRDATVNLSTRFGQSGTGRSARNSSTDPQKALFSWTLEYQKYSPHYDQRGTHRLSLGDIRDANGNAIYGADLPSITVGTRPLRGKRPSAIPDGAALAISWESNPDPLGVKQYEVELAGNGSEQVISASNTSLVTDTLPGGYYSARVRAQNVLGWGEWSTYSAPIEVVVPKITNSQIPSVSGGLRVGDEAFAETGMWEPTPTSYRYQWFLDGSPVPGATSNAFTPLSIAEGKSLRVEVTPQRDGYVAEPMSSISALQVQPRQI